MMTPAIFSPFRLRSRRGVPALFDDVLGDFPAAPWWQEARTSAPEIRIDVGEDDKAYRVRAEIPGAGKDDIDVSVEGNRVAIRAELKREARSKDEQELVVERSYGSAYRTFTLPGEVDAEHADARYEQGVLTLTLPKRDNGSARRIAVR